MLQLTAFALFEAVIAATLVMIAVNGLVKAQGANIRRYVSIVVFALVVGLIGYFLWAFDVQNENTSGFSDFVLLTFANVTFMVVLVQVCLYVFPYDRWSMQIVDFGYYGADTMIGLVLFGLLFLLSVVQIVDSLQALLLFSSELLQESRRGAQVRLFDQRFGDVRVGDKKGDPKTPTATRPEAPANAKPGPSPGGGRPGGPVPVVINPWRSEERPVYGAKYGTVGAQQTITDSRPLRQSIWERRRIGDGADQPAPAGAQQGGHRPSGGTYRPPE